MIVSRKRQLPLPNKQRPWGKAWVLNNSNRSKHDFRGIVPKCSEKVYTIFLPGL
jgi:hypothetical protein